MRLLINVKITEQRLKWYSYPRAEWLPVYNRLDIFKYCLSSYSALLPLIDNCNFYIELDPEFEDRKNELDQYIRELFATTPLDLNWFRISTAAEWRNWCDHTLENENELIWWAGNDDHIFIDSSLEVLKKGLDFLAKEPHPLAQLYYSHWPEMMRFSNKNNPILTNDVNYVKFNWAMGHSAVVLKAARWKRQWRLNWGNRPAYRTDDLVFPIPAPVYVPTKELVRHYDGYGHVSHQASNLVPPLYIPNGFFEKQMTISYGDNQRHIHAVNINPMTKDFYSHNILGTDFKGMLEDIPLFWNDRIVSINQIKSSQDVMKKYRNDAFIAASRLPVNFLKDDECIPPIDWFKNHLI